MAKPTYSDIVPVRRVVVGDCDGPLGSGFDALAQSAFDALLASPWTVGDDPPFLPVHDNGQTANKTIPHGDAWKCTYGYNAAARTERSACGAVAYTFKMPNNATAGSACNFSSVDFSVVGDRYLDAGVDVYLIRNSYATPPTVAQILASNAPISGSPFCATSSQSVPPNERTGVTAQISVTQSVAATEYVHVVLLLRDYLGTRGAWIEGGAMLDSGKISVTFSRSVAEDSDEEFLVDAGQNGAFPDGGVRALTMIAPKYEILYRYDLWTNSGGRVNLSSSNNLMAESMSIVLTPAAGEYVAGSSAGGELYVWTDDYPQDTNQFESGITAVQWFSTTKNYSVGDSVFHASNSGLSVFKCTTAITGVSELNPHAWNPSEWSEVSPFSAAETYAVGDYVTYRGNIYRCTTAVSTAGSWDSTKWALSENLNFIPKLACFVRSGYLPDRTWSAIKIAGDWSYSQAAIPLRLVAYAVSGPVFAVQPAQEAFASIDFWNGNASKIKSVPVTSDKLANNDVNLWSINANEGGVTRGRVDMPVVSLLATTLKRGDAMRSTFALPNPVRIGNNGYPTTVFVAVCPWPDDSFDGVTYFTNLSRKLELYLVSHP